MDKIIFYFKIYILFIVLYGCGDRLPVVDPPVVIPACIGNNTKNWSAKVDIMESDWTNFNIIFDNGGVNPVYAFLKKGRINIGDNNIYKNEVPYSIPYGGSTSTAMDQACENLSNLYRNGNENYVMGLDSFQHWAPGGNAGWSNGPNHSGNYSNWSFIFSGFIQGYTNIYATGQEVVEAIFVHELGHQIAITDHGPHTGNDADNCLMGEYNSNMLERFQFCDGHLCTMYNQIYEYADNSIKINNNFECEISLDKNTYYEGEAIWASIKIINTSNSIDSLPYSGADYLIAKNLIVKDENGNIYTYHGSSGVSLWVPYEHFLPKKDTIYHIELINDFGNKYEDSYDKGAMLSYFEPGNYSLQLIHEKAGLVSELKSFTIYKPDEDEMQRLNILRQIYGIKDRNERITEYYKFIENNAGSIFIPQTIYFLNYCYNVLYLSGKKIDNKLMVINNYFLENYPNSYFASEIIRTIWRFEFQQSRNVLISNKKLNEIISSFPKTYSEIISKYWLNSKPSLYDLEPKIKNK